MNKITFFFMPRYKKLLHHIKIAKENKQILRLPNGVELNFVPGSEYGACAKAVLPREDYQNTFVSMYMDRLNEIVKLTVYDCFEGDVKILAVGSDRIFVEIVDTLSCYACQEQLLPGERYWIEDWLIAPEIPNREGKSIKNESPNTELPF